MVMQAIIIEAGQFDYIEVPSYYPKPSVKWSGGNFEWTWVLSENEFRREDFRYPKVREYK